MVDLRWETSSTVLSRHSARTALRITPSFRLSRFHSVLDQHQDIVVALESRMNPVVEPFVEFDPVAARIAAEQDNHLGRYGPADVLCEDFEFLRFALRQVSE